MKYNDNLSKIYNIANEDNPLNENAAVNRRMSAFTVQRKVTGDTTISDDS